MYVEKETLLRKLPPFRDEWVTISENQNVHDIIHEILEAHDEFAPYYDKIALYFDADTIGRICDNLGNFCKENIRYREETEDDQTTALPAGILTRGYGDCKHYASFCGGILDALNRSGENIDWNYRFASYRLLDHSPHHVFVVVNDKENNKEIWIDPTPGASSQFPYWQMDKKIKSPLMALNRNIAGIGETNNAEFVPVDIPKGSYLKWVRGQWYIVAQPANKIGEAATDTTPGSTTSTSGGGALTTLTSAASAINPIASLIPVGLSVIQSISKMFSGSSETAMQKMPKMFPIPPNATIGDIEQLIDAINQHWEAGDYQTADSQWRDAYNAYVAQLGGVLRSAGVTIVQHDATAGYNGPLMSYSNPENITASTAANVIPSANPNSQNGVLLGSSSNSSLILLAIAAVLLFSGGSHHEAKS